VTVTGRRTSVVLATMLATVVLIGSASAAAAADGDGTISGQVFQEQSRTVPTYADVFLFRVGDPETTYRQTVATAESGYVFTDVSPGQYKVCFGRGPTSEVIQKCYIEARWPGLATPVTVGVSADVTGIDGYVLPTGSLSGSVFGQLTSESPILPLTGVSVWVASGGNGMGYSRERSLTIDASTNTWRIDDIPVGTYYVQFNHPRYLGEWWGEAPTFPWGPTAVEVYPGSATALDGMVLNGRYMTNVSTERITGADRFGTGVAVSKKIYETVPAEGVPVVYIANGMNFPDALAAGPAAIENDGVVLLVFPWAIPPVVQAELTRLDPQRIVVTGGTPSVDENVYRQLGAYVDDPASDLVRLTGADRFGTSREIARDTFPGGADYAFIATGLNYPDALAAGPASGQVGGPVILVNGKMGRIDIDTVDLLDDLGVEEVFIIGGSPSVSPGIEADLRALPGISVTRITGADRFGTSVAIAQYFFEFSNTAYLATGLNFPDALAGGPLAAANEAPLYLSPQWCLPRDVAEDILAVGAWQVAMLGGPPSLADSVIYRRC